MIAEAKEGHPGISERDLCRMFGVSRSWYYERPCLEESAYSRDVELRNAIERIVLEFPGYGYRRVTKELQRRGWAVNHKRVLRIMREQSLLCQLKRRFKATTDSAHSFRSYPNLIKDVEPEGPDLALRHNLHSPTHHLLLSGSGPGRLFALLCGLVSVALDRHAPYAFGTGDGALVTPAGAGAHSPFGPGRAVRKQ
jgi:hypothetical protein